MAFPTLSIPKFPTVPNLPGVPNLLRSPVAAAAVTALSPLISSFLGSFAQVWGVFDAQGNQVLTPDTFLALEYTNSRRISNFPVEQGSFASYNKVNDPFSGTVRMAVGGTLSAREQFLADLQMLADSLDLYTLVMPEASYINVNMDRFDFRRETRNGAGVIVASCHFVEIRQAQTAYSGQTSVPTNYLTNPTTSTGLIDPAKVTSPMAAAVSNMGMTAPKVCSNSVISSVRSNLSGW
ncbi:MAG: hypothetical protein B7X10_03270 [Burkholderiales bacterium 21-58-4]|nr:MAG: hypothetical protein B7X10_03270 [Burkholderiales bacterium 21-58-4]